MVATQLFGEGQTEITQDRIKDLPKHIRDEITRDTTQPLVKIDPAITDKLDTSRNNFFSTHGKRNWRRYRVERTSRWKNGSSSTFSKNLFSDRPMRIEDLQSSRKAIDMSIASSLHRQIDSRFKDIDYKRPRLSADDPINKMSIIAFLLKYQTWDKYEQKIANKGFEAPG
ncbi:hypothetical protein P9112_002798 [Eukaryota sp. TZLM1-RC]